MRDYSSGVTEDESKSCSSMVGPTSVKNSNSVGNCEGLVGKRPQFSFSLRKIRYGQQCMIVNNVLGSNSFLADSWLTGLSIKAQAKKV